MSKLFSEQEKRRKRSAAKSARKLAAIKHWLTHAPEEQVKQKRAEIERELGISLDEALRIGERAIAALRAGQPEPALDPALRERVRVARPSKTEQNFERAAQAAREMFKI